jgi:hypothetical protein
MEEGFKSGYEAIGWALRRTRTPIIDGPNVWLMGRKTGYRDMMPTLDAWEKLAEAALILKNLDRSCPLAEQAAVVAYFTGGRTYQAEVLVTKISHDLRRDKWFVQDCVWGWSRGRPIHSLEWWSKRYKIHLRTIQRWSTKIQQQLDTLFSVGLSRAEDALRESGHVV